MGLQNDDHARDETRQTTDRASGRVLVAKYGHSLVVHHQLSRLGDVDCVPSPSDYSKNSQERSLENVTASRGRVGSRRRGDRMEASSRGRLQSAPPQDVVLRLCRGRHAAACRDSGCGVDRVHAHLSGSRENGGDRFPCVHIGVICRRIHVSQLLPETWGDKMGLEYCHHGLGILGPCLSDVVRPEHHRVRSWEHGGPSMVYGRDSGVLVSLRHSPHDGDWGNSRKEGWRDGGRRRVCISCQDKQTCA
mmetsp:Transcript_19463/g.39168  ORF Transcript_19463/g.39168 Transcript_19463/m.39168 type:complete len:248 (+) Transcript_19463:504-1247(+)